MAAGLIAAVVASVCYGVASVLQALAARRSERRDRLDPRLLVSLAAQLPYVAGLGLDLAGFCFNVLALRTLPLFVVESIVAGSVGVTAVVAARLLHVRISTREARALVVLVVGVALLALAARAGPAEPLVGTERWLLLGSVAVVAVAAVAAGRIRGGAGAVVLAALAGASFGGVGVAARGLRVPHPLWRVAEAPEAWAAVAFGVLATLLFATALQRGSVTIASAVMLAVETILPAIVGVIWLGDATRPHTGPALAGAGLVIVVAAVLVLAPYADPTAGDERAH